MSYRGMEMAKIAEESHLGGNVWVGDAYTFCPAVWTYVVRRFCILSVLDLGSGMGHASRFFHGQGLMTVAVDGLSANVEKALFPTVQHDIAKAPFVTKVDLVHCQEVVEHIEPEFVDNLLRSLMVGRIIMMTHALPGQGGYHHVNLQPSDYWIAHMAHRGCQLLEEDTRRIREMAHAEGARYVAASGLLFVNEAHV